MLVHLVDVWQPLLSDAVVEQMFGIHEDTVMSNQDATSDTYDRGIIPAETAARKEREGENYKQLPDDPDGFDTTGGYTVDSEGLANNYAIEPEMYIDEPGDLRESEAEAKQQRQRELQEVREDDETGKLTADKDSRGHGPGVI
jgi:hypothetical protein